MSKLPALILACAIAFVCGAITLDIAVAVVKYSNQVQPAACRGCQRT